MIPKEAEKVIITIDGRVCSGKSTLIQGLLNRLSQYYGYNIPHYSCGEYYRNHLRTRLPNELVDDAMIDYVHQIYQNNDRAIIDGRSSGFSLQGWEKLTDEKKLITVLCDVNQVEQVDRIKARHQNATLSIIGEELERDHRDKRRCFLRFGRDIFDRQNYDIYIDTSGKSPSENLQQLLKELNKKADFIGARDPGRPGDAR